MVLFPTVGGIYADRWRRKRIMVGSDWLRSLILLPLLAVHGTSTLWIVYVTGFLGATLAHFAGPFGNAALQHVVAERDLAPANAAFSVAGNAAVLVGAPLGGILLQRVELSAVVLVDALSFMVSGLLVMLVNVTLEESRTEAIGSVAAETRSGWRVWVLGMKFIRRERWISILFIILALAFVGSGIIRVALAPFVKQALGGSPRFYSWALTAQDIGEINKRLSPDQLIVRGLGILGVVDLAIAVAVSPELPLVGLVLSGPPALVATASLNTILQTEIPDAYRGRVFGAYLTTVAVASLLGALLAGPLVDVLGSRVVFGVGAALFTVAGLCAAILFLPPHPAPSVPLGMQRGRFGKRSQNVGELALDPGMEDGVDGTGHPLHPHSTAGRMKERQLFGGAAPNVFMRNAHRLTSRVPVRAG